MMIASPRHSVFAHASSYIFILALLVDASLATGHKDLNGFQVLLACSHSLHQLQVFFLHVFVPFCQLINLKRESQIFFFGFSFCLYGSLHVLLVHSNALINFAWVCFDSSVMFVDLLDVFDVPFGFSFVISDEPLYFLFIFLDLGFECVLLGGEVFDLCLLSRPGCLFLIKLYWESFLFFLWFLFEWLDFLF